MKQITIACLFSIGLMMTGSDGVFFPIANVVGLVIFSISAKMIKSL